MEAPFDTHTIAAVGAGFLLAVLWFDLMFDVQVRKHAGEVLPAGVLASIGAYYRRVTTGARPMNVAVPAAMAVTVAALTAQAFDPQVQRWRAAISLALTLAAAALALARTVDNARRLGAGADPPAQQSRLARAIYRDHQVCLGAMLLVVALQLTA